VNGDVPAISGGEQGRVLFLFRPVGTLVLRYRRPRAALVPRWPWAGLCWAVGPNGFAASFAQPLVRAKPWWP